MNEGTLIFNGDLYISSERAGKLTGYTTDYIGQLARAGKIDARLIGRSWYVKQDAICKYKLKKAELEETATVSIYAKNKIFHSERQRRLLMELLSRTALIHLEGISYEPELDAPLFPPLVKKGERVPNIASANVSVTSEAESIPSPLSVVDVQTASYEEKSSAKRPVLISHTSFAFLIPGTIAVVIAFVLSFGFESVYTYSSGDGTVQASVVRAPLNIDF